MDKAQDQNLISNYLSGDKKSLEILINKYLKQIYNFIYRFTGNSSDTEDLVQEVFVRVWKNAGKFDSQKSFKTWIYSIAKNAAIDFLRKKKATPFSALETDYGENLIFEVEDQSPLPNELYEKKEISQNLNSLIGKLSPKYRKIFDLKYNLQLSFCEIAKTLGEPINTVRSRYRRGLSNLKKISNLS